MTEAEKQILYRDARITKKYDDIWRTVGKCVFCDLNDKYLLFEEHGIVMTISLFAYIDGHFMIIPRRHVTSVSRLTQLEWETIRRFMHIARKLIKKTHKTDGVQFIQKSGRQAQSTVDHIHFHCIPFDQPDLSVWNLRQLTKTPLENVAQYKQARRLIVEANAKFEKKYAQRNALPVVCDLIVLDANKRVLMQKRRKDVRFIPDTLCTPGGAVDRFDVPLEEELAREVQEETGWRPDPAHMSLHASRVSNVTQARHSPHLKVAYPQSRQFLWNTYIYKKPLPKNVTLTPGDDCAELLWIPLQEAVTHYQLSQDLAKTLRSLLS